jgi:hypothetical protein
MRYEKKICHIRMEKCQNYNDSISVKVFTWK